MTDIKEAELQSAQALVKKDLIRLNAELDQIDEEYFKTRKKKKKEFVDKVLEANTLDISTSEIAKMLDKARQSVYRTVSEVIGVRYPQMRRFGKHEATQDKSQGLEQVT